jgi:hypothetical protein
MKKDEQSRIIFNKTTIEANNLMTGQERSITHVERHCSTVGYFKLIPSTR